MTTINASTPLIKIGKNGAPNVYPVYLAQVRRENPDWSFIEENDPVLLSELGYEIVERTEPPVGDVVTEVDPVLVAGVWQQTWSFRAHNTEEVAAILTTRKTEQKLAIEQLLTDALEIGFPFTFDGENGPETGHVQLRDKDRGNVAGCGSKADRLIAQNVTGAVMPFRTFEDVTYMCTPLQMQTLSNQAYDAYLVFMNLAWTLKDNTVKATTLAELPVVPSSLELPQGWESLLTPTPDPEM